MLLIRIKTIIAIKTLELSEQQPLGGGRAGGGGAGEGGQGKGGGVGQRGGRGGGAGKVYVSLNPKPRGWS